MYWDANNLYGGAMCEYLPCGNLQINDDVSLDVVENTAFNSDLGYIAEVDIWVPKEIHEKVKECPPCPESLVIRGDMLSSYQLEIVKKNDVKIGGCAKLVPRLMDKVRRFIHYRNLKFIKELGMVITPQVHNIVSFNQKPILKESIDFNTSKRKEPKNDFEKDFLKINE